MATSATCPRRLALVLRNRKLLLLADKRTNRQCSNIPEVVLPRRRCHCVSGLVMTSRSIELAKNLGFGRVSSVGGGPGRVCRRAAWTVDGRHPRSRRRRRTPPRPLRPRRPSRRLTRRRWSEPIAVGGRGSWRVFVTTTDACRTCHSRPRGRHKAYLWCARASVSCGRNCWRTDVHSR